MEKRKFYVYQEDLIMFQINSETKTISRLVSELNKNYCKDDMKRLRTKVITDYLVENGYLVINKQQPTDKGKLLGIKTGVMTDKNGQEQVVILYNERAQKYILDNIYEIIAK